jgi:hypothetical protein
MEDDDVENHRTLSRGLVIDGLIRESFTPITPNGHLKIPHLWPLGIFFSTVIWYYFLAGQK